MSKRLYFNAFSMNCVVHQSPGLWVRPEDQIRTSDDGKLVLTFFHDYHREVVEPDTLGKIGPADRTMYSN